MRQVCVWLGLICGAGLVCAQEAAEPANPAYDWVRDTETFAGVAVGEGGGVSRSVLALRLVVQGPDARAALLRLLDEATLPGQLYALCGLRHVDRQAFDARVESYLDRDDEVWFLPSGCDATTETVGRIVRVDSPRAVRLEGPDDSLEAWRARQGLPAGVAAEWDVFGGAWTAAFELERPFGQRRERLSELPAEQQQVAFWVEQLTRPYDEREENLPWNPVAGLKQFGLEALVAVTPLLEHPSVEVRRGVAHVIASLGMQRLGGDVARTLPLLLTLLSDDDYEVRDSASSALAIRGAWASPPIQDELLALLQAIPGDAPDDGDDAGVGYDLVRALIRAEAAGALAELVTHDASWLRLVAIEGLAELGPRAAGCQAALLPRLHDPAPEVRESTLWALRTVGLPDAAAVAAVAACLERPELAVDAARALAASRPEEASAALAALDRLPESAGSELRAEAALARWQLSGADEGLLSLLVADMVGKTWLESRYVEPLRQVLAADPAQGEALVEAIHEPKLAIALLLDLGPVAASLVPVVRDYLRTEAPAADRHDAAWALVAVGELDAAVAVFRGQLADDDLVVRRHAALALVELGSAADAARPELRGLLSHDDAYLAQYAARALAAIGDPADRVALVTALTEADAPGVRAAAARALAASGASAEVGAALAKAAEEDPDPWVRAVATEALFDLGR